MTNMHITNFIEVMKNYLKDKYEHYLFDFFLG